MVSAGPELLVRIWHAFVFNSNDSDTNLALRAALKELGFEDCYHMMSASVENPPDCLMWLDAFAAKFDGLGSFGREQWDQLLGHCQAVCDWPAVAFSKELIEAYPEAKIIITSRDVDSWYASTMKTVHWRATEPQLKLIARMDWAAGLYQPMLEKFWEVFWEGDFEKNGKRRFQEHYMELDSVVPKERVLNFRIEDGWKPLCEFLDVPVPEGKHFPCTNDTGGFVSRCLKRNRMQMLNVVFRASLIGAATLAVGLSASSIIRKAVRN